MYTYEVKDKKGFLKVKVSKEEFEKALQNAYEKNKGKFKVQGFRPGKAPRKVIEQNYGDTVFFDDAFEEVMSNEYSKFLEEHLEVRPAGYPNVEDSSFTADKGIEATLTFDLMPEVELGSLTNLKAKLKTVKVDEKQINDAVEGLRNSHARFVETQKVAENGDFATIDFSGSVDGVKFEGGTAQDYKLELGSHTFIEGFEEQVVGMKIGEKKDVNVKFPENYNAENLKGKPAVFEVTLKKVETKQLPEVNDKFISDVTEFENLEEYKKDLSDRLLKEGKKNAELEYNAQILEEVCERSKVDIPESMVENEVHEMIHDFEHRLSHQGMTLDNYLEYLGQTLEEFKKGRYEDAKKNVKTRLVLQKIIAQYKISVTNEDMNARLAEYATTYGVDVEEMKKTLSQQDFLYFQNQALMEKIISFIKAQNK